MKKAVQIKLCLSLLFALALLVAPFGISARAGGQIGDLLPGAFGEHAGALGEGTRDLILRCADRALMQLLEDFERAAAEAAQPGYLQILQTTVYLPDRWPSDATQTEKKIWAEYYSRLECAVSFVAMDNTMNLDSSAPYAEVTGRFEGYAIPRVGGGVERFSLREIRSRTFAEPVVRGVRVINLGSHYNAVYTTPLAINRAGVPLLQYLEDPALWALAANFEGDFPASVFVRRDGEAGGAPVRATDPKTIRAVFEALCQITVRNEWPISGHTDDELHYTFEMADGRVLGDVVFQDGMLLDAGMGLHEITGYDALQRALTGPG